MSLSTERSQTTPKTSCTRLLPRFGEEADVAAELQQVVLQRDFDVVAAVVPLELRLGFLGEAHRPRHVGRPLSFEHQAYDVAIGHPS